jgi:DNA-directed RNA polymerase subunit RPC12/RpoP
VNPAHPTKFEQNVLVYANGVTEPVKNLEDLDGKQIAYYKCKQCKSLLFSSYHAFKQHFENMHYMMPIKLAYSYQCDICKSEFRSLTAYNQNRTSEY